jgi:hypothetical protein
VRLAVFLSLSPFTLLSQPPLTLHPPSSCLIDSSILLSALVNSMCSGTSFFAVSSISHMLPHNLSKNIIPAPPCPSSVLVPPLFTFPAFTSRSSPSFDPYVSAPFTARLPLPHVLGILSFVAICSRTLAESSSQENPPYRRTTTAPRKLVGYHERKEVAVVVPYHNGMSRYRGLYGFFVFSASFFRFYLHARILIFLHFSFVFHV